MYDDREPTDVLLELLRTAVHPGIPDERRVGDHDGPDPRTRPYGVLYVLPAPAASGSWADTAEMGELVVQVSSVGDTRDQAQAHQHGMRQLIMGKAADGSYRHPIAGDGWKVYMREHDGSGGIEGGGDLVLWTAIDRFRLGITSA